MGVVPSNSRIFRHSSRPEPSGNQESSRYRSYLFSPASLTPLSIVAVSGYLIIPLLENKRNEVASVFVIFNVQDMLLWWHSYTARYVGTIHKTIGIKCCDGNSPEFRKGIEKGRDLRLFSRSVGKDATISAALLVVCRRLYAQDDRSSVRFRTHNLCSDVVFFGI